MAQRAAELQSTLAELMRVRSATLAASRHNVGLAGEVLRLAEEVRRRNGVSRDSAGDGNGDGDENGAERELRRAAKRSRQGWRTMKAVASAMVAGSGVDWAGDPVLVDIVLDVE